MMDPIFEEEQQHLTETYRKLQAIQHALTDQMQADLENAQQDKENMLDDLALDFAGDVNLETYVELEAMHQVIDSYNRTRDIRSERLLKANMLLRQPYFAKVTLQFNPDAPDASAPRDIYIGAAGMTDETRRHFVIDWRSPVAETYYNQENGRTSYQADNRTIEVDLKLRRQFDVEEDRLHSYFDTTVAIQDHLLLASLKRTHTDRLQAITTTIQKEQNAVIRHQDVPALLVSGIAGSGKTSVLLQRIAYLLYRHRDDLSPDNVYLITPNDVFARYISDVLPDMGERNPQTLTWNSLMSRLDIHNRKPGSDIDVRTLQVIDEQARTITLEQRDMADLFVDNERVFTAGQIYSIVRRHLPRIGVGSHLSGLVEEELHNKLETRIQNRSANEDVQEELFDLDTEEQFRLFGRPLHPHAEEDLRELCRIYLADRYANVLDSIERGDWLRIDRVGMRMLGTKSLSEVEYLYCKLALTGSVIRQARYVMVDEVQDYTPAQLTVLAKLFQGAHFLLLGDENQALCEGTASFNEIERIFQNACGLENVSTCHLGTSYRSTPEITDLFAALAPAGTVLEARSVQEPGDAPRIQSYADEAAYWHGLIQAAAAFSQEEGISAIIAADAISAQRIAETMRNQSPSLDLAVLDGTKELPAHGLVITQVALAKGLEFDRVLIPDANAGAYPADSGLARRKLYTAISRATRQVTLLAFGTLTPLLAQLNRA